MITDIIQEIDSASFSSRHPYEQGKLLQDYWPIIRDELQKSLAVSAQHSRVMGEFVKVSEENEQLKRELEVADLRWKAEEKMRREAEAKLE